MFSAAGPRGLSPVRALDASDRRGSARDPPPSPPPRPRGFAGPFEVNGVPLRRCNQAYVIATSTQVDVSKVKVPDSIDDGYFSKDNDPEEDKKADEEKFFATGKKGASVSEQRKKDQAAVDKALMGKLNDQLKAYLAAKFSLSKGQRPHEMKF